MASLIVFLLIAAVVAAAIWVLPLIVVRMVNKKRYAHIFEQTDERASAAQETETEEGAWTGISRDQLKRLYQSGLISKEEYKAGLKNQ